jgi:hypothetical protein
MWGGGFMGILFCLSAYFYYHNIFDEFFYWSFIHSYIYGTTYKLSETLPRISNAVLEIAKTNFPLILVALLGNLIAVFKKNVRGYFALGFLLFSFLATVPGPAYRHYFAQLALAVAIVGGFGFSLVVDGIGKTKLKIIASVFFAVAVIATPVLVHSGYYITKTSDQFSYDFFGYTPFPASVDLAKYLSERTTREDTIFIYGSEPQILLMSQRKSATSFALIYPLVSSFPRYMEFQHKAWEEVLANMPKYIVAVYHKASYTWDGRADLWIQRKTNDLLVAKYSLEAVVTKEKPKGRLLSASEAEKLQKTSKGSRLLMYVYKRRI